MLLTLLCLIWASLAIQAAAEGGGAWHSGALLMAVLLIVPTIVFCGLNGIRLFAPARFASPRWTVVGGTSYVFTGLATVLFAWLLIFETTWHRSVNELPATFDQRPSNATAAASGESPADVDKAKAPRELALARAKTAGTKRQRFEPKQGMENKSSWGVVPKPSDLNSNGWAGIAYMSLGGVAPITLPGEAEPVCKLKLTKGNDDQITLEIEDLKQNNTLTVTLGRDQPAEILVNGKGYRVRYCAVRVNLDQPDSSPFAQVILKPVEGPVEPSRTVMATGALKRAPLDSATWQIEAMVAEADIAPVAAGQEVSFTIDAFPRRKFRGKVVAVADVPTIVQNVNCYATTIEVTDPDPKFKPGMTAYVGIIVAGGDQAGVSPGPALPLKAAAIQDVRDTSVREWFDRIGSDYDTRYGPFAAMNATIAKARQSDSIRDEIIRTATEIIDEPIHEEFKRWQCCYVLSGIGDERGIPALKRALQDKNEVVRGVAGCALGAFDDSDARSALEEAARTEKSPAVQEWIRKSLDGQFRKK